MNIDYILTAFSPAMFGNAATAHIQMLTLEEAKERVDANTLIQATRSTHEMLARNVFPQITRPATRYADLTPGRAVLHLHYRGPPIGTDGVVPAGSVVTPYLIEVEEFQEAE
jgi:hypothetical protein